MTTKQLNFMWTGIGFGVIAALLPPCADGHLYPLLFVSPSTSIDMQKLFIEWLVIAAITFGWIKTSESKHAEPQNKSLPIMAVIAPLCSLALGVWLHVYYSQYLARQVAIQLQGIEEQKKDRALEDAIREYQAQEQHQLALKLQTPIRRGTRSAPRTYSVNSDLPISLTTAMIDEDTASYTLFMDLPEGVTYKADITLSLDDKNGNSLIERCFDFAGGKHSGHFPCSPDVYDRIKDWHLEQGLHGEMER